MLFGFLRTAAVFCYCSSFKIVSHLPRSPLSRTGLVRRKMFEDCSSSAETGSRALSGFKCFFSPARCSRGSYRVRVNIKGG